MLAVELHSHSADSHDGRDSVERMLAYASRNGLDAIAITDHDVIEASLRAVDLAPEYGLVAIPGIEVSSEAGHVLALGVDELVPKGLSFAEIHGSRTPVRVTLRQASGTAKRHAKAQFDRLL